MYKEMSLVDRIFTTIESIDFKHPEFGTLVLQNMDDEDETIMVDIYLSLDLDIETTRYFDSPDEDDIKLKSFDMNIYQILEREEEVELTEEQTLELKNKIEDLVLEEIKTYN